MRHGLLLGMLLLVAAPVSAQAGPTDDQIREALARYRNEPSVARVVRAAVAERSASPGRVRDAMDRARATGWLPTTRASVRRGQAVDLRALTGDETPTNVSTDDDLVLDLRATFRFDRIVFAPQETSLLRELRAVEAAQLDLEQRVVSLWFERRRLQLEADLLGLRDLVRRIRVLEIEALLDAFTGGAFTRMMGRRRGVR